MLTDYAKTILLAGSIKFRVKRAGMFQLITFNVKRIKMGNIEFPELYTSKLIDLVEIIRLANHTGLPVESANTRSFPDGMGAIDFSSF